MNERDYRSYMDRIEMTGAQHDKLMNALQSGQAPVRRGPRILHYAAAAACLALVLAAGFGMWLNPGSLPPDLLENPALPGATPSAGLVQPTPAPDPNALEDSYVLSPADPFDGQPHSSPDILAVEFDRDAAEVVACISPPDGWFEQRLTREDMIYLLGGENAGDAPWMLYWVNYDVTGSAIYDGSGRLWQIQLFGVDRSNEFNSFTLKLASGQLPPACYVDPDQTVTELHGVQVYGSSSQSTIPTYNSGTSASLPCYCYKITLMNGSAGLCFTADNMDEDTAAHLAVQAANVFTYDGAIHLDRLLTYDGDVPEWRSESLTLAQAQAEQGFEAYVKWYSDNIPAGFTFESAHRELGQDRDYLSLSWTGYYTYITVTLDRTSDAVYLMDVNNREYYDERLYTIPYAESVPYEVMFGGFQDPVFAFEDLTLDVVESRVLYKGDLEDWQSRPADVDRMGYRGNFDVLYPDGMLASFSFKGVLPEEALRIVTPSIDGSDWGTSSVTCIIPHSCEVLGAAGSSADLEAGDANAIYALLHDGTWTNGNTDCICDYTLVLDDGLADGLYVNYHADCGTFNDTAGSRSLKLSAADRDTVNAILTSLGLVVPTGPTECPFCPLEDCAQTGTHLHDGVYYCARTACTVDGCTETGFHRHGEVCYQGCAGHTAAPAATPAGAHHSDGHHGNGHYRASPSL